MKSKVIVCLVYEIEADGKKAMAEAKKELTYGFKNGAFPCEAMSAGLNGCFTSEVIEHKKISQKKYEELI